MNFRNKLILIFCFLCIGCTIKPVYENNYHNIVRVDFKVNDSIINFYDNVTMSLFSKSGKSYYIANFKNGLFFPEIIENESYNVRFHYKSTYITFQNIILSDYGQKWFFSIDETPKDNFRMVDTNLSGTGYFLDLELKNAPYFISHSVIK